MVAHDIGGRFQQIFVATVVVVVVVVGGVVKCVVKLTTLSLAVSIAKRNCMLNMLKFELLLTTRMGIFGI